MCVLSLLVCAVIAPCQQTAFVSSPDTLGQDRQKLYQGISSQISPSIKARVNIKAFDSLGTDWRANDDGGAGETYIFPAGHSDRLYVTGVNPGWNAEQSLIYQSVTCFSFAKGVYSAVWTIDWRDPQDAPAATGLTGLAKIIGLDPQRVDNKYIHDELTRVRGYAVYRKGDGDSPWYSEFYDDQGNRTTSHSDDASKSTHVFNTLVDENNYLTHHS